MLRLIVGLALIFVSSLALANSKPKIVASCLAKVSSNFNYPSYCGNLPIQSYRYGNFKTKPTKQVKPSLPSYLIKA